LLVIVRQFSSFPNFLFQPIKSQNKFSIPLSLNLYSKILALIAHFTDHVILSLCPEPTLLLKIDNKRELLFVILLALDPSHGNFVKDVECWS